MLWLVVMAVTLMLVACGKRLRALDEVYAMALYIAAGMSGLWGIAIAPTEAQLILGISTLLGAGKLTLPVKSLRF
ncbi:MAG: hypothetical protein AAFO06_06795 [Cyanobacteria bacterium J06597_16]